MMLHGNGVLAGAWCVFRRAAYLVWPKLAELQGMSRLMPWMASAK
jgi:hypothetical protein